MATGESIRIPAAGSGPVIMGHVHQGPTGRNFIPGSMAHNQLLHEVVYGRSGNAEHRALADRIIAGGQYSETSKFKLLGGI